MSVTKWILLVLLILVSLTYIFREDISFTLADYLIVNDKLEKAEAIAVLGGESPERVMEAVDIYREGYGGMIILTRGSKPEGIDTLSSGGIEYEEEFERNYGVASEMGIKDEYIKILKPRVEDTIEEIKAINEFMKENAIESVIIVTSKYHSRRTSIIADHIFDDSSKVIVRTSRYGSFDPETVLERPDHWKVMLLEYQKIVYFYLTRVL